MVNSGRYCLFLVLLPVFSPMWSQETQTAGEQPTQTGQTQEEQADTEQPVQGDQAREGSKIGEQPVPKYLGPEETPPETDRGKVYFNMFASLLVVLGVIVGLAYGAKKLFPNRFGGMAQGNHLKLLQSLPLGPRRFVTLIEADGKRFLLGVSETQINLIKALDEIPFEKAMVEIEEPKTVRELWEEET